MKLILDFRVDARSKVAEQVRIVIELLLLVLPYSLKRL